MAAEHTSEQSGAIPDAVLSVRNLTTRFRTDDGVVTAVDRVSFDLRQSEALGLVGESGCGKSVTSKSILRLLPAHLTSYAADSRVLFGGVDLMQVTERQMRDIRGNRIAMIFQEPMTALNPVFTVGWQLDEALKYHTSLGRSQRRSRVIELMKMVEIPAPEQRADEYPHQLSGGMRQRIMIAMALACEPEILIADEPTTALDVTIQAQILKLMSRLRSRTGAAVLLITHDLGVIAQTCSRVVVMYAGQVVETAPVSRLFQRPAHPYTRALLDSIPRPGPKIRGQRLTTIPGLVPGLFSMPQACRFADRCSFRQDRCESQQPALTECGADQSVRCHFPLNIGSELSLGSV